MADGKSPVLQGGVGKEETEKGGLNLSSAHVEGRSRGPEARACPWHRGMFFLGRWPGDMLETMSGIGGRVWELGVGTMGAPWHLSNNKPYHEGGMIHAN